NRADLFVADPDEFASRAAELSVKRLHPPRWRPEVALEKFFENVHQDADPPVSIVSPCAPTWHPEPSRVLCGLCEGSAFFFEGRTTTRKSKTAFARISLSAPAWQGERSVTRR